MEVSGTFSRRGGVMGKPYKQRPEFYQGPQWSDVFDGLEAFETDFGMKASITFSSAGLTRGHVHLRVWREVTGERLGIHQIVSQYPHPDHKTLEGCCIKLVHIAYQAVYRKCYDAPFMGNRRPKA
jgi:hypothetical protein